MNGGAAMNEKEGEGRKREEVQQGVLWPDKSTK